MNEEPTLPQALREALEKGRLLVFCGAGISVLAPSHLPTWWGFNVTLLESAKNAALAAVPDLPTAARSAIESLSLERFPIETFSEKIVQTFAGSSYFPLLKVLESDRTNANHRALAELARRRQLRAIVTTNFDTLLERAFREAGLGLAVLTTRADHAASQSLDLCALLKIHGSVTAETSLVDTVSQKLRGLAIHLRAQLAALYREFHVLVLGFSGADLNFGSDYLALSSIDPAGPGLTWVVRPGQGVSPHVRATVGLAGSRGAVVEAELPAFFTRLGLTLEAGPTIDAAAAKERAEAATRQVIAGFYGEPHVGPFAALALCSRMLSELGDFAAVDSLHGAIAGMEEVSGEKVGLGVGAILLVLASHQMQRGAFEKAGEWFRKLLGFHHALIRMQTRDGRKLPARVALETRQNLAVVHNNLALCAMHLGQLDEARQQLAFAEKAARDPESRRILCRIFVVGAEIATRAGESADRVLEKLRRARAFAAQAGEAATLAETALSEAEIFISILELDAALRSLRRARPFFRFHNTLAMEVGAAMKLASVARLRHRFAAGLEVLVRVRRKCLRAGATDFARSALLHMVRLFSMCAEVRTKLLAELDAELAAEPERERWQAVRDALAGGMLDEPLPILVRPFGLGERELEARRVLAEAEGRDLPAHRAQALANLCHLKYEEAEFTRLADLAEALRVAATRAASPEHRLTALNFLGIARERLGDLPKARETYRAALASEPSSELAASLRHNLALVEMRLGHLDVAEGLLREALEQHLAGANDNDAANQIRFLAQIEARRGDLAKALRVLDDAAEIIARARSPDSSDARAHPPRDRAPPRIGAGGPHARGSARSGIGTGGLEPRRDRHPAAGDEPAIRVGKPRSRGSRRGLRGRSARADRRSRERLCGRGRSARRIALSEQPSRRRDPPRAVGRGDRSPRARRGHPSQRRRHRWAGEESRDAGDDAGGESPGRSCARGRAGGHHSRPGSPPFAGAAQGALRRDDRPWAARRGRGSCRRSATLSHGVSGRGSRGGDARHALSLAEDLARADAARLPAPAEEASPVPAAMAEAERLRHAGRCNDALAVLDSMDLSVLGAEDCARLLATRGNVLQTAGQLVESSSAFEAAAALFHEIGEAELAARAEHHRIVNLRRSGRFDEAESQLRASLASLPKGLQRAGSLQTLANVLMDQILARDSTVPASEFETVRAVLAEARECPGVDEETLGIIELTASNIEWLAGDCSSAITIAEKAREHLLRCNSRHLTQCETVLTERRDQFRAAESGDALASPS